MIRLINRRHVGIVYRPTSIGAEAARERRQQELGFTPVERPPDPVEDRAHLCFGQLKAFEAALELSELLLVFSLQLLFFLLLTDATSISLGEKRPHREDWVWGFRHHVLLPINPLFRRFDTLSLARPLEPSNMLHYPGHVLPIGPMRA